MVSIWVPSTVYGKPGWVHLTPCKWGLAMETGSASRAPQWSNPELRGSDGHCHCPWSPSGRWKGFPEATQLVGGRARLPSLLALSLTVSTSTTAACHVAELAGPSACGGGGGPPAIGPRTDVPPREEVATRPPCSSQSSWRMLTTRGIPGRESHGQVASGFSCALSCLTCCRAPEDLGWGPRRTDSMATCTD